MASPDAKTPNSARISCWRIRRCNARVVSSTCSARSLPGSITGFGSSDRSLCWFMTDRFSQTSLAVTKVMPIALGAPAGHRVSCCLRLAASTSDQTSVIRLHSAKCKRTISRHSDVGVFEWSQTTNICSRLIAVKVRFGVKS